MRVQLIDFDSKIPNLALMKISSYHKSLGHTVGFDIPDPDKVYISTIFKKNKSSVIGLATMFPKAEVDIGGVGWDIYKSLPENIELIKPDYDLYPSTYSQGYTTRGCIRKCEFCVVPTKEGKIKTAQHPRLFHDDRFDTCMIMDNNLLAAQNWWIKYVIEWFRDNNIRMLSPQGWDARLLSEDTAGLLKDVKHAAGLHFAWDNIKDEEKILNSITLLKDAGFSKNDLRKISYYVLVGFNSTFEEDLYRCIKLKQNGVCAFVMKYHNKDKRLNDLARWANRRQLFWSMPFENYKP